METSGEGMSGLVAGGVRSVRGCDDDDIIERKRQAHDTVYRLLTCDSPETVAFITTLAEALTNMLAAQFSSLHSVHDARLAARAQKALAVLRSAINDRSGHALQLVLLAGLHLSAEFREYVLSSCIDARAPMSKYIGTFLPGWFDQVTHSEFSGLEQAVRAARNAYVCM
jgi:hypothetical protein